MDIDSNTNLKLSYYIKLILINKWWLIIPFFFLTLSFLGISLLLPDMYKSTTLILIEPQKIPQDYVKPTISVGIEMRLQTLKQQIMSRTRLQKIMDEFDLYKEDIKVLSKEEKIQKMREAIDVQVMGSKGQFEAFSISYEGIHPGTVMMVTNKLASLFIEENLKLREQQVHSTTEFIENELLVMKHKLEEKEKEVMVYRQKFMGELPEQMDTNLRVLDRIQLQLQSVRDALSKAEDRRLASQNQLSGKEYPLTVKRETKDEVRIYRDPEIERLEQLKATLKDLSAIYTDEYPDVVSTKKEIQRLEMELTASKKDIDIKEDKEETKPKLENHTKVLPMYRDIANELSMLNRDIIQLRNEEERLKRQIEVYEKRIEQTPKREQELTTLSRDYDVMMKNYQAMLNKKIDATLSENLEIRQKGEQFKILDPANYPEKPFKPNRIRITLLGAVLGIGIGTGMILLKEHLEKGFKDADELQGYVNLPVLVSIPRIITKYDETKKLKKRLIFATSFSLLIMACSLAYFYYDERVAVFYINTVKVKVLPYIQKMLGGLG